MICSNGSPSRTEGSSPRARRCWHRRSGRSALTTSATATVDLGAAVEVDIFGEWVAGELAREPLFDPKGERVRG